ncbi:MAG: transporter [Alphaproteobacteria bacterium]|nr:transporter [Alphaproteobacteria bacterium]
MGSINPLGLISIGSSLGLIPGAISTAVQVASQVGALPNKQQESRKSEQSLALQQLQERQGLQQKQLEADSSLERERIAVTTDAANDERRAALRRAVARQRARFGASGIGNSGGGSSEAVLLGLFEESDDDLASRERLDKLRNQALDLNVGQNKSLNVLQRSQLQQRQKFEREVSSFF